MATLWTERGLGGLEFPRSGREEALAALRSGFLIPENAAHTYVGNGGNKSVAQLEDGLNRYFRGETVSFTDVPVDLSWCTPFQKRVLELVRRIAYGEITSYARVAAALDHPRAARAVGGVLRENRVPIVIPCHRVVRSDGSPGGFSGGPAWKTRLLALEGRAPDGDGRYRLTNNPQCANI